MGILDTIITTKQNESLNNLNPSTIVSEILGMLKERDKKILINRYGLSGNEIKTLAAIGKDQNLTRERVRQIEKDLLKTLKKNIQNHEVVNSTKDLLLGIVAEHGKIIAEGALLDHLNLKEQDDRNAVVFLLYLIEELEDFMHANYKKVWSSVLFNKELLDSFIIEAKKIFSESKKPLSDEQFLEEFKKTEFYLTHQADLSDQTLMNFLDLAHEIEKNVFGQWGLVTWKEINPKDVGDKAYLVLRQHGKPEHYSAITEMINSHGFDGRKAYKETVHNELIKDNRFILIGRGIYALAEWGFKAGVVSDVIAEILKDAGHPLSRESIIEEVMKRRMIKKNTILVGLSNKKLFKKVGKNQYSLV
jgi:hypothetical protein